MSLSSTTNNFILLPGLVPSNIDHFINLLSQLENKVNVLVVTENECLVNLFKLNSFPNLFVYTVGNDGHSQLQQQRAKSVKLYQWYKFNLCLTHLKELESLHSFTANRVFKLRFDYLYQDPLSLLRELSNTSHLDDDILYCESDRIFFGSRMTMFSLRHFLDLAVALFLNKSSYYYPLHYPNLKKSSLNVTRWERVNFDRRVFDCPSINDLYSSSNYINQLFSIGNDAPQVPPSPDDIYSFHTGNLELPAERSFAWYLNVHGIIAHGHSSMSGGIFRSN